MLQAEAFMCGVFSDGELHPADGYHQRFLHGFLLPRCKAASFSLHQESLQHGLPPAFWEVHKLHQNETYLRILWSNSRWNSYSIVLSNRVTGVYEITLCHVADNGSPGETEVKEDDQR